VVFHAGGSIPWLHYWWFAVVSVVIWTPKGLMNALLPSIHPEGGLARRIPVPLRCLLMSRMRRPVCYLQPVQGTLCWLCISHQKQQA
jgi:hypothetical protein